MRLALLSLLVFLVGCGPRLMTASLTPRPRAAGRVELEVSCVTLPQTVAAEPPSAPADMSMGAPGPDGAVTLPAGLRVAVQVTVRNPGPGPAVFHPAALRLDVRGHQGTRVTAMPIHLVRTPGSTYLVPRTPDLAAIPLPPGTSSTHWVVFDGFGGISTATSLDLRLRTPDIDQEIVLSSPTAPAPAWNAGRMRGTIGFGFATRASSGLSETTMLDEEVLASWGRLVLGLGVRFGVVRYEEEAPRPYLYETTSLGLRAGWLPLQFPLGVIAGADIGSLDGPPESTDAASHSSMSGTASVFAAFRFNMVRWQSRTRLIPINRGTSPVGLFTIDLGYVRWLPLGRVPATHGLLFRLGINVPS